MSYLRATWTAALLTGCLAAPEAAPLRIVRSTPAPGGDLPATAPIRIDFDGYLDPEQDFSRP
ncbi:MAG: hypothetical protein R3F43_28965 [bacterium]